MRGSGESYQRWGGAEWLSDEGVTMNVAVVDVLSPDDVWGAHAVVEGEPPCVVYKNVLFDPKLWGLFDGNGEIILNSAFRRGVDGGLIRSKAVTSLDQADLPVLDQDVVYMGGLLDHFGHFICTSLARMWAWSRFPGRPFLFHGREVRGHPADANREALLRSFWHRAHPRPAAYRALYRPAGDRPGIGLRRATSSLYGF